MSAGLDQDCPFPEAGRAALAAAGGAAGGERAAEAAAAALRAAGEMDGYCERLRGYLGELEQVVKRGGQIKWGQT